MVLVKIWQFIHVFILGKIVQENVFYNSLGRKKPFLDYKNNKLKMSKNWHGFGQKLALLSYYYFRKKRPGKCVLRYSGKIKRLFRL